MAKQFGLFNDESDDWTENSAVESGFYSAEDAETAIAERYSPDDELTVHVLEEPEDDEETGDDDDDEVC